MKIIKKLAYKSAFYIQKCNNSSHENKRILYFGFEAIYGDIVKLTIVICASAILRSLFPVLAITLAFAILRRYAGGFHMDSEGKCLLATFCSFVIPGTLLSKINFHANSILLIIINAFIFIACLLLLIKYAPKDCINRPIDEDESIVFKRRAIRDIIILTIISIILAILDNSLLSFSIMLGIILEVFTLVPFGYNLFKAFNSFSLAKKIPTSK